jgi:signal transduction histidine kinase
MAEIATRSIYSLFDHVNDGICIADAGGKVLYLNEAARRLLETSGQPKTAGNICEFLCDKLEVQAGRHAAAGCPLRDPARETKAVTFLGRHGPHAAFNWNADRLNRAERWKDIRVRCLKTSLPADGSDQELHLVVMENAAPEMDLKRHRADWRNMIAHDLRAPLTSIFAALRLLEEIHPRQAKGPQEQDTQLVEMSVKACRRMMELLDLYLDVARLDADAMRAKLEDLELRPLVVEALDEQRALAAANGIAISNDVPPGLKARVDSELLGRVVGNLVNNAIKYNVQGGALTIAASSDDSGVRLSFKDTGRGIDPKDLPFIFDRYYQAEARRAGRIQGNGLGLTFCKEALELMDGSIAAESEKGKRTEFVVALRGAEAKPG